MKESVSVIILIMVLLMGIPYAKTSKENKSSINERVEKIMKVKKWCIEGTKAQKAKNYDEAIVCYKQAIVIDPDYALAHHNLGYAYHKKGLNSLAADHLYKAGLLFLEQGNRNHALKSYEALKRTESKELEQTLFKKLHPELEQKKNEPSK